MAARPIEEGLTDKQFMVLQWIAKYKESHGGNGPTYREIAVMLFVERYKEYHAGREPSPAEIKNKLSGHISNAARYVSTLVKKERLAYDEKRRIRVCGEKYVSGIF